MFAEVAMSGWSSASMSLLTAAAFDCRMARRPVLPVTFNGTRAEAGTKIVVDGYQSKDRSNRANGRDVTFPDGKKLFMGSSGTGAPRDGKDATEPPPPGR